MNEQISNPINPGEFSVSFGSETLRLGHSGFNTAWFQQLGVGDPKIIFDIGGYDGGDAIRFKQMFPTADVYCFEADQVRAEKIKKYITHYGVIFHDIGISEVSGEKLFYPSVCMGQDAGSTHLPGERAGQGSFYRHSDIYHEIYGHIRQLPTEKVVCMSISDHCLYNKIDPAGVTLMHIDAEGSEHAIIQGFGQVRPKLLYIETLKNMFEKVPSVSETHDLLLRLGYELIKDFTSDRLYIHS